MERGTAGWRLMLRRGNFEEKPLREMTIVPLIRLGLLDLADEETKRLLGLGTRTGDLVAVP